MQVAEGALSGASSGSVPIPGGICRRTLPAGLWRGKDRRAIPEGRNDRGSGNVLKREVAAWSNVLIASRCIVEKW